MKTFTYVAAIALLTAGTAFAQSSMTGGSTMNNSTPTPSATSSSTHSGSMNQSSMDHQSRGKASKNASKARTHHVARSNNRINARENQETRQLNLQQLAGNSASMAPSGMSGSSGMSSSGAGNPFNNGSPQQAQAGGANCTPDNPSCGTARQNPAINSPPQHRTYGTQEQ